MRTIRKPKADINSYIQDRQYIANTYVMKCFSVSMIIYFVVFLMNMLDIFIVDQKLMVLGFVPSVLVYLFVYMLTKRISLSDHRTKYFIMFNIILVFTLVGVTITYHVVFVALLPIIYATLYTSKRIMWYVYGLTVLSTVVVVYGGYYIGLCDANMALLTTTTLPHYLADGQFTLTTVNANPAVTLMLYFVLPRCLIHIAFIVVCNNIFKIIRSSIDETKRHVFHTVTALSDAVDAKDRYTSGHSKRVAKYAKMIAERMGKTRQEQEEIFRAGLLHDVGKIRIPDEIINKPGRLTEEEFNMIKIHPVTGYHILKGVSEHSEVAIAAKYHHERYDGKGYPNGLSGDAIPEIARILCVADSYDAMTSNRSYREGLPQEVVRHEIESGKGTQFDPQIADVMLMLMDEDKEYSMRQDDTGHRKILVVGDEQMVCKIMEIFTEETVIYDFTSVGDGKTMLEALAERQYDLILLDETAIHEKDRRCVLEKVQTPMVLITEDKSLTIATGFGGLGYADYISKPLSSYVVKEVVYNMTKYQ